MSELHSGARRVDPLDALRAADHRPIHEVWRERLIARATERLSAFGFRPLLYVLVGGLAIGVIWQLFLASAPPVEDNIPFAQSPTGEPAPVDTTNSANSDLPLASSPDEDGRTPGGVGAASNDAAPLTVHVAGAVHRPGLVSGLEGWRIDDAVRAAGGALAVADLDRLNLAALLGDGERIYVPKLDELEPSVVSPTGGSEGVAAGGASAVVDVNTASEAELQTLPGVGPATAATIIEHREQHGHFADVDALVAVRGIGPATLERLRDHVRTS